MSGVNAEIGSGLLEEQPDAQLIENCLNGDQASWEALIRRYQNLIYSVPIRYHFSASDAADVFQHVCVTMLEKLKTLRNTQTLSSWLYVTTKRHCWKISKKQRMEVELEDGDRYADEPQGESLIFQHQVKSSLDQLSEKCKELIRALYYADPPLSYDEITAKFGIPFGSIGPTRARCLEKLRKVLTGKD
ncbi:MAG TPA: RNA polymerase sigma factor [Acidobacteriota bacterium]|nr:RNA polymerase sigma factor [Acidobacteriota bacterium]